MSVPPASANHLSRRSALGLVAGAGVAAANAPAAPASTAVAGLAGPVEIVWDRHGIPHITAQSREDAFFGQGYAAATARLWQIDLARRRALGRLAAVFGAAFLPWDVAARTVLFRGDLAREWAHHDPAVPPLARAWVRGINARIAQVAADPALLPPEFTTLDMRPEPWAETDPLLMRDSAPPNVRGEMRRAALACRGLLALDALVAPLDPPAPLTVPAGLDPCRLHPGQLALLDRLTGPLPFAQAVHRTALDDLDARQGSNGWVIAPSRTTTGRALLANDPHLAVGVPGPRFITHLRAPGLDAIGAGPAYRPGFQFGHNDRIAFGRTDLQIDQEDLYVLELDGSGASWRGPSGPEPVERVTETIAVRDAPAAQVTIGLTALGPLIHEDRDSGHALVLRSALRESGPALALEYIPVVLARSWPEYRQAVRTAVWGSNYLYADVDGNIGWQAAGRAPRRRGHDGLLPVPAAGGYAWDGYRTLDEMPHAYNPPCGWIATANQMPYPPDWPEGQVASREWIPDDRYRRIAAVLGAGAPHAPEDSLALQQDVLSLRALALRPVLAGLGAPPAATLPAATLLTAWDGQVTAESEAAALFELWWAELGRAARLAMVPEAARDLIPALHPHVLLALVTGQDPRLPDRLALARSALQAAEARWRSRPEGSRRWGDWHVLALHHALGAALPGATVPTGGSAGDGATVKARWWVGPDAPRVSGGASFRAVIDLGRWEAARCINLPGQSGDPRSPHYADLVPLWLADRTIPLAYSTEQIEALAERRTALHPA